MMESYSNCIRFTYIYSIRGVPLQLILYYRTALGFGPLLLVETDHEKMRLNSITIQYFYTKSSQSLSGYSSSLR